MYIFVTFFLRRVYGIKDLRVVDCSIFPEIPSGNTNAPVIMAAEKASDMIKMRWGYVKDVINVDYVDNNAGIDPASLHNQGHYKRNDG